MNPTPEEVLRQYWGYEAFRPLQRDIVQQPLDGSDALALLPTGGGKSICFQVPALCMGGICIVISPLIALMKDQVQHLMDRGIPALALHSGMSFKEIDAALDRCVAGEYRFLYLSPERLRTEIFKVRVRMMDVRLIAVDEAHCISQWGYDFRPPYLQIADLRELLPKVPVLALTATATPTVVEDIQKRLAFKNENVIQGSFRRANLTYMVLREEDRKGRLLRIYARMPGCSVIYVRSRKRTADVADFLISQGITATSYHAGLAADERDRRQEQWMSGKVMVMVATNAFGMGIDKPDVRTVVHLGFPDSLEAYFQEAGRAGRDGEASYAVALVSEADVSTMRRRMENVFPSRESISAVYHALGNWFHLANGSGAEEWFDLDIRAVCKRFSWAPQDVMHAIAFLERADHLILSTHTDPRSTIRFTIPHALLHELEERNPRTARVTRVLLRSYASMFEDHVHISEGTVASRAGFTEEQTIAILERLHKAKVIDYRPSQGLPKLNFVGGRLPKGHLYISTELYEERKESVLATLKAALHYVESRLICRGRLLVGYFGETDAPACGKCDVCISKHDSRMSTKQIYEMKDRLRNMLMQERPLEYIINESADMDEDDIIQTLRAMVDEGVVSYDSSGVMRNVEKPRCG